MQNVQNSPKETAKLVRWEIIKSRQEEAILKISQKSKIQMDKGPKKRNDKAEKVRQKKKKILRLMLQNV